MTERSRIIDSMSLRELEHLLYIFPDFAVPPECTRARSLVNLAMHGIDRMQTFEERWEAKEKRKNRRCA